MVYPQYTNWSGFLVGQSPIHQLETKEVSYMPDDSEYIEAKIVGGECLFMRKDNLVGFCHFPEHKGRKTSLKTKSVLRKNVSIFKSLMITYKC